MLFPVIRRWNCLYTTVVYIACKCSQCVIALGEIILLVSFCRCFTFCSIMPQHASRNTSIQKRVRIFSCLGGNKITCTVHLFNKPDGSQSNCLRKTSLVHGWKRIELLYLALIKPETSLTLSYYWLRPFN